MVSSVRRRGQSTHTNRRKPNSSDCDQIDCVTQIKIYRNKQKRRRRWEPKGTNENLFMNELWFLWVLCDRAVHRNRPEKYEIDKLARAFNRFHILLCTNTPHQQLTPFKSLVEIQINFSQQPRRQVVAVKMKWWKRKETESFSSKL